MFIEEIYRDSTLESTSEYYLIDWLRKGSIREILKEEGFSEEEINYALNYLSLSYEISQLINNKKLGLSVEETIKQWINIEKDKIRYVIRENLNKKDEILKILYKFRDDNIKIKMKMLRLSYLRH